MQTSTKKNPNEAGLWGDCCGHGWDVACEMTQRPLKPQTGPPALSVRAAGGGFLSARLAHAARLADGSDGSRKSQLHDPDEDGPMATSETIRSAALCDVTAVTTQPTDAVPGVLFMDAPNAVWARAVTQTSGEAAKAAG